MEETRKRIRLWARATALYCRAFGRWFVLASVIGGVCGLLGAVFHIALEAVTELRAEQSAVCPSAGGAGGCGSVSPSAGGGTGDERCVY